MKDDKSKRINIHDYSMKYLVMFLTVTMTNTLETEHIHLEKDMSLPFKVSLALTL